MPQRGGNPRMQLMNPDAITKMRNCKAPCSFKPNFCSLAVTTALPQPRCSLGCLFGSCFWGLAGLVAAESTRLGRNPPIAPCSSLLLEGERTPLHRQDLVVGDAQLFSDN